MQVRPLAQRDPGKVSLYACGPTVYDHPHLGHARQALTYDVLRRYLEWRGVEVHHVANVTDIDDNIINRANKEGLTEPQVAAEWEAVYIEVMDELDILHPHDRPHATEFVDEMVAFIATLMDNGSAYATESGVYLRVRSVPGYGDLVHRSFDELAEGSGARVEVDEHKEDPLDFALWKSAKPDEPTWPSPWGPGRPGWHIECVAMSLGILGDGFDLHGGGDDLVFPHHTNERAEAIAAGRPFAQHWLHNAMLNVGGEKMAKSLGNFRTVRDLLDEHPLNARALRLLLLQTHYRKTMEVNAEVMTQARAAIERIDSMARRAGAAGVPLDGTQLDGIGCDTASLEAFVAAMDNDLGTPEAVAVIFDTVRRANTALDTSPAGDSEEAARLVATVVDLTAALGIGVGGTHAAEDSGGASESDSDKIEALVAARSSARDSKDFAEADRLRDELTALGVVVEDTPNGPVWHRR
ncbi:MAG: cysteine--tRNA ligase [Acidimicrobiaceae bacterium]|nr:cysteine--tRNA ligase [Acidimicrobiaceae bacterium]MYC43041.1 cysteine--tRNA ligase [Acidimicrobiaceae bacterium]MYD07340.1 cysteine--tRNA ligase [Acidimicrobiaceae bacterium]MYH88047.1 cysteine--tRNA ligase [Acidimicrobiaceae bacterium]MYJ97444.1 cysteine--tRNA ligase [Acidimicrobiaceae bacterium]